MIVAGRSHEVQGLDLHDGRNVMHVTKRVLIGRDQGARTFVMRLFTLGARGASACHAHPWEHEVYVLAGKGHVRAEGATLAVAAGDFVFVPPMEEHQFANVGSDAFEFLCVVPMEGEE